MSSQTSYEPGMRVLDLTFDPPGQGTIVRRHETRANAYYVRIDGGVNDVIIAAHNLSRDDDHPTPSLSGETV